MGSNVPPWAPSGAQYWIDFANLETKVEFMNLWDSYLLQPTYNDGLTLELKGYDVDFNGMRLQNLLVLPMEGAIYSDPNEKEIFFMQSTVNVRNEYPFGASESDRLYIQMQPQYFYYDTSVIQQYYGPDFYGRSGHLISGVDF
jgi:hypothetical protein